MGRDTQLRRVALAMGALLLVALGTVLLVGFWLVLVVLGLNPGYPQNGGWVPFAIVLVEVLLVGGMTAFMPGAHETVKRRTAYAAVVWLMVIVNVLLFTFVIHIY